MKKLLLISMLLWYTNFVYCQFQPIQNNESGLSVRNNLNRMFSQIYDNSVVVAFSPNGSSSWHDLYTTSDHFIRYSSDMGITWSPALSIDPGAVFQFSTEEGTNWGSVMSASSVWMRVGFAGVFTKKIRLGNFTNIVLDAGATRQIKIAPDTTGAGGDNLIIEAGSDDDGQGGGDLILRGGGLYEQGSVKIGDSTYNGSKPQSLNDLDMTRHRVVNMNDPDLDLDAVNLRTLRKWFQQYLDTLVVGIDTFLTMPADTFFNDYTKTWLHSGQTIYFPNQKDSFYLGRGYYTYGFPSGWVKNGSAILLGHDNWPFVGKKSMRAFRIKDWCGKDSLEFHDSVDYVVAPEYGSSPSHFSKYKVLQKGEKKFYWAPNFYLDSTYTILGYGAGATGKDTTGSPAYPTKKFSNAVLIGHKAQPIQANQLVLGDSTIKSIYTPKGYYSGAGFNLKRKTGNEFDSLYLNHLVLNPADSGKWLQHRKDSLVWATIDSVCINGKKYKLGDSITISEGSFDSIYFDPPGVWAGLNDTVRIDQISTFLGLTDTPNEYPTSGKGNALIAGASGVQFSGELGNDENGVWVSSGDPVTDWGNDIVSNAEITGAQYWTIGDGWQYTDQVQAFTVDANDAPTCGLIYHENVTTDSLYYYRVSSVIRLSTGTMNVYLGERLLVSYSAGNTAWRQEVSYFYANTDQPQQLRVELLGCDTDAGLASLSIRPQVIYGGKGIRVVDQSGNTVYTLPVTPGKEGDIMIMGNDKQGFWRNFEFFNGGEVGDIIYFDIVTGWTRLSKGLVNQILTIDEDQARPKWRDETNYRDSLYFSNTGKKYGNNDTVTISMYSLPEVNPDIEPEDGDLLRYSDGAWNAYKGATGSFVSNDNKTVTVENGLIVAIDSTSSGLDSVQIGTEWYKTVTIGTQTWLQRNLHYDDSEGGVFSYSDETDSSDIYGYLYTWEAAMRIDTLIEGWHLPSVSELELLGVDGERLKDTGTRHWYPENTYATNTTGFSAIAAGLFGGQNTYEGIGYQFSMWSNTKIFDENDQAYYIKGFGMLGSDPSSWIDNFGDQTQNIFRISIRLIKDSQ